MIGLNKRFGVRRGRRGLNISNPFVSTGWKKPSTQLITGRLNSVSPQQQMLATMMSSGKSGLDPAKIQQALSLANPAAAMMSGINSYYNRPPTAVRSVEGYEKQLEALRELERASSKIYSGDAYDKYIIGKYLKKRNNAKERREVAEYFATAEDADINIIPNEYKEDVMQYYLTSPEFKKKFNNDFTEIGNARATYNVMEANKYRRRNGMKQLPLPKKKVFIPFPYRLNPIPLYDSKLRGEISARIYKRIKGAVRQEDDYSPYSYADFLAIDPKILTESDVIQWNKHPFATDGINFTPSNAESFKNEFKKWCGLELPPRPDQSNQSAHPDQSTQPAQPDQSAQPAQPKQSIELVEPGKIVLFPYKGEIKTSVDVLIKLKNMITQEAASKLMFDTFNDISTGIWIPLTENMMKVLKHYNTSYSTNEENFVFDWNDVNALLAFREVMEFAITIFTGVGLYDNDSPSKIIDWLFIPLTQKYMDKLYDIIGYRFEDIVRVDTSQKSDASMLRRLQSEDNSPPVAATAAADGAGVIKTGGKVFGWRAPPIFKLVQPLTPFSAETRDRTKEREEQHKRVEERREEYKRQQERLHGKTPPSDMVKRALPDIVEPIYGVSDDNTAEFMGLIPHSFIVPRKRFRFSNSVTF